MVNGNYVLYGDRPSSESEIVSDHVQTRTAERKNKRKSNRNANDLHRTLNMAQLDNDTDSVKFEKSVKEPRLLRYVPTSDVKENFVTEKFETYDLKPNEELPRRYTFQKKPKNPADGSVNYAYSRSSSSCSSPNTNLPTISEHGEQYGTYRVQSLQNCPVDDVLNGYEKKMDKYFTKPKELKSYNHKARYEGSHPDSLYRVQPSNSGHLDKMARVLRLMRWPVALLAVCIALGLFVYFLMPDHIDSGETLNSTQWDKPAAHIHHGHHPAKQNNHGQPRKHHTHSKKTEPISTPGMQPPEIDFYEDVSEIKVEDETFKEVNAHRVLPIKPVYPEHVEPEVQYGNEKADTKKLRTPKILEEINVVPDESTLKPYTTLKVDRPAVYFKDLNEAPTTETITRADIANTFDDYEDKQSTQNYVTKKNYVVRDEFVTLPDDLSTNDKTSMTEAITRANTEKTTTSSKLMTTTKSYYNDPDESIYEIKDPKRPLIGIKLPEPPKNFYNIAPVNEEPKNVYNAPSVNFTSGHSNLFGIGIEDAEKMRSSTQSSLYNTRVSPTLPTWRDGSDATTLNYPSNVNSEAPQCRSTHLPLCRGVLPYDLASSPVIIDGSEATAYMKQFNFLVASNCSERTRQFVCALLEPECNPAPYPPKMPCYNLCKSIADTCYAYIPKELESIFSCGRYPREECAGARGPCGGRETACADGSCILRDWVCDGRADCLHSEDELQCSSCQNNEFRCASGGCIQTRWLCDGYADCPRGEDELGCAPAAAEHGEEPGSQAAPSVTRPHRVPPPPAHTDESKEILMTSDTNNGLRRNFTRRPSKSRLAPYTRPTTTPPPMDAMDGKYTDEGIMADLGWYEDLTKKGDVTENKEIKELKPVEKKPEKLRIPGRGRAPPPAVVQPPARPEPPVKPTKLDKSINNLEKVLDGAALMRQAAAAEQAELAADSLETNSTAIDKNEEMLSDGIIARPNERYTGRLSAHRSPCPSGELRCVDGRCITLAQLCDGTIDCTDHADEDNCYT